MKKIYLSVLMGLFILVLSGCSFGSSNLQTEISENGPIWKSVDGGASWQTTAAKAGETTIASADILSLVVNPFDASNVYAGLKGGGILKTIDGGASWRYLNFQSEKVYGLELDPTDGRIVYASGVWQKRGKVFKSADGGENWKEIFTTPLTGPLVIAIAIDKKNSNVLYLATSDNQVLKTTDGGVSWKNAYQASGPVVKIAIDSANSSIVYLATQSGAILRSKDAGGKFEDLSRLLMRVSTTGGATNVETDPGNAGWVYATGAAGILFSKNAGDSWEKINTLSNSRDFPVKAFAVNPRNSRELQYSAGLATYLSVDGGVNWKTFQFQTSDPIGIIRYAPTDPSVLYLGTNK